MRRRVLPLGLAALLLSPFPLQALPAPSEVPVEPTGVLTLERALARAVRSSPVLAAARHQVQAAQGGVEQASLRRNPSFGALVEDTRRDTRTATATVDVPLEIGGQRAARTLAAERRRELAEAERVDVEAELKAVVGGAFREVLIAQERLALANDSAALAAHGADVVGRRVAAGKVSPVDDTRARVDAVNATLDVTEAESTLAVARQALAASWGESDLRDAIVVGDLETLLPERAVDEWPALVDRAPRLFASRVEVARRRALLEVEKSRRIPDVTVTVGAKRDNDLGRTQMVVGLSVPLPLFDRNQGGITEAARLIDQADDEQQATRIRIVGELQRASSRLTLARQTAGTLKTVVLPAAEDALRTAARGFEVGKFGFIDVLDAQRTLLAARTRYLAALTNATQAATAIDRLLGR